ncbi:MAG: class I SAM-dependent methyltransferase [Gemmataceae bacterium]|nr:class I SAM-dependent methyltransferase [Gemmataceae bacterium]
MDASSLNPTGRFTGLADTYARHRPDYPDEAIAFILRHCGLAPGSRVIDVGSGTGISSRPFAAQGMSVIGIEPNPDMRRAAEAESTLSALTPSYRNGRAESTGLPDAHADLVLAAQAFHWFETDAALAEFHRVLKRGGWVALLWNERDETDPFTVEYGTAFRIAREAAGVEQSRKLSGDGLLASPLFQHGQRVEFGHAQALDEEGLLGRAFSASYAPREPEAKEQFTALLRACFARYQQGSEVMLRYRTSVTVAQRKDS